MKVKFWGTQGSLPAPSTAGSIREKIFHSLKAAQNVQLDTDEKINQFIDNDLPFSAKGTYGTNTACVEIEAPGNSYVLFDAGTGLRDFSFEHMKTSAAKNKNTYHIFMSHLHWDHIQGFPFFVPAYIPGNTIIIHGYHSTIEACFREQMKAPVFPVEFENLSAEIIFDVMEPGKPFQVEGYQGTSIKQNHPGDSYGYRFEKDGKVFVYSSDCEHKQDAYEENYPFIDFYKDADLLIFDAQYTLAEATFTKANWGHSSNIIGIELATKAKVRKLALFHHEPTTSDKELDEFLYSSQMFSNILQKDAPPSINGKHYPEDIFLAYDGLEVEIP